MPRKNQQAKLGRKAAFKARPLATDIVSREPLPNGGEKITFWVRPGRMHRVLLRLPERVQRSFEFDPLGIDLINQCDGKTTVRAIIRRFVEVHNLDEHEAEKAVTTFLRTLMQRGIVSMWVPK